MSEASLAFAVRAIETHDPLVLTPDWPRGTPKSHLTAQQLASLTHELQ